MSEPAYNHKTQKKVAMQISSSDDIHNKKLLFPKTGSSLLM